jgi:hypothetical protein
MTDQIIHFLNQSLEGLKLQTSSHAQSWGLGTSVRWGFSMDTGVLQFTFPDKVVSVAAEIVGTLDRTDSTWLWAWANESIPEPLVRPSRLVRDYAVQNHLTDLTHPSLYSDEAGAWQLTALANRLRGGNGAYRGPAGDTFVYFIFADQVHITPQIPK